MEEISGAAAPPLLMAIPCNDEEPSSNRKTSNTDMHASIASDTSVDTSANHQGSWWNTFSIWEVLTTLSIPFVFHSVLGSLQWTASILPLTLRWLLLQTEQASNSSPTWSSCLTVHLRALGVLLQSKEVPDVHGASTSSSTILATILVLLALLAWTLPSSDALIVKWRYARLFLFS